MAYNFAMFETSPKKEQPKQQAAPEIKVAKASASKSGKPVMLVLVSAFVLAVFMLFVYNKAQLSELNLRIANETEALSQAQTINTALTAQLDRTVTLDNVEEYAQKELGMQKVNSAQEKYVEMNTGTMTEAAVNEDGNIFVSIQNWFDGVLEYLGF